jgi:fructokinase
MKILSIGEVLWDVFPDAEKLGGALFNFSYHAHRLGHEVLFLSAVGEDRRGDAVIQQAAAMGLATDFIRRVDAPTGVVTVELDAAGKPTFTIHRPAAYDLLRLSEADFERIARWQPDWIAFGTLHQMDPSIRALLKRLIETNPGARRLYDINLRKESYTPELIAELLPLADVVKLNDDEVAEMERMFPPKHAGESACATHTGGAGIQPAGSIEAFCRSWSARHGWRAMCVTLGARGCAVLVDGAFAEVPGYPVEVVDTVGSGDAFTAAFLHGMGRKWPAERIGDFANRLGALVASRAGGVPTWTLDECSLLKR